MSSEEKGESLSQIELQSESQSESQFRCMLCDFTATSKPEIGNHFLTDHMDAYVSPVKEGANDEVVEVKTEQDEGEKEDTEVKKGAPKRRGRPKRPAGRPPKRRLPVVVQYVDQEEEEEKRPEDSEPQPLGRGMRRRKKTIPRHILRYEVEDDEYSDDDYGPESQKEKKKAVPKKKFPAIVPLTMKEKAKHKAQKRVRSGSSHGTSGEDDEGRAKTPKSSKKLAPKASSKLPLPDVVVERILDERWSQWFIDFKDRLLKLLPCPLDGCAIEISQAELDVHVQCHSANLEGFRCPDEECEFLCPHWTNMRVHYRKEHSQSYGKMFCSDGDCTMIFPRVDQNIIQVHVVKKHLRPRLYEELLSKDFDEANYEKYASKPSMEVGTASTDIHENDDVPANSDTNQPTSEQTVTIPYEQDDGIVETVETVPTTVRKTKKRGRPLGSTKAVRLAAMAAGLVVPGKSKADKAKEKARRPPRKIINHVTFFCDICGAKYKSQDEVFDHKNKHFQDDDLHIVHCTECNEFNSEEHTDIREHVENFHKPLLHLHRCEMCSFSTNRYHDLKKHIVVHSGSKDYMCDKCGTCTTTAYNLRVHWRRYHAPESDKSIACFACDYKCADNGILKEHIRSKHGLMVYGKEYDKARPMPTYTCPDCDYVGRKKSSLTYHMRIHTENRQFKCHICPYASKTKNNLLLHIRTHEGMQPLKCPQCDFRGATNKIISEHVMCKHARVRPYTCKICGWTSSYHGNMWKHVETHRRELGDAMPDDPVSVVSTDGHLVAAPLKAPTLKKRGSGGGGSGSGSRTPRAKNKRAPRPRYEDVQQTAIEVHVDPSQVQDEHMKDGNVVIQLPSSMLDTQTITLSGDISEEAAMGASALSRLAQGGGGEITVREVHFIHEGSENHQQHHEMITYNVPPVAVTQQIIAGGDMGHVITEQQYHEQQQQQQHHEHQRQQQEEHERERYREAATAIQHVQVVTTQHGENGVPTAVTEQVVRAMPQHHHHEHHHDHHRQEHHPDHHSDHHHDRHPGEQAVVHQLIPMTLPPEAELVMSMMQAHHASISQAQ